MSEGLTVLLFYHLIIIVMTTVGGVLRSRDEETDKDQLSTFIIMIPAIFSVGVIFLLTRLNDFTILSGTSLIISYVVFPLCSGLISFLAFLAYTKDWTSSGQ